NGRCVRDRVVSQALQAAYRGLLLNGKHPVAFLFLELPPDGVDVNVHPTKSEVRFRRPEAVQGLIIDAVGKALKTQDLTAPLTVRESPPAEQGEMFGRGVPGVPSSVGQASSSPARQTPPVNGRAAPARPVGNSAHEAR